MIEITIAGPGKNALGIEVMERLLADLAAARDEPVLLTGAGDAFSAGLNLKQVAALDRAGMEHFLDTLERLMEAFYLHPAPTAAAVGGHAIAGGCVLTLCCDHRVATTRADVRIGLNEVALGLEFPPKLLKVVRRRIAPRSLERVLLEAGLHDPATAYGYGLVDELADDPLATARARLERLAAHPRAAYVATKRALRGTSLALTADEDRRYREQLVPAWCTPEVKERVLAQLRRR